MTPTLLIIDDLGVNDKDPEEQRKAFLSWYNRFHKGGPMPSSFLEPYLTEEFTDWCIEQFRGHVDWGDATEDQIAAILDAMFPDVLLSITKEEVYKLINDHIFNEDTTDFLIDLLDEKVDLPGPDFLVTRVLDQLLPGVVLEMVRKFLFKDEG